MKSINCTGFFLKKVHVNNATGKHGSTVHWKAPRKQQNAASPNLRHVSESWWVLPSKITIFFVFKH